MLWHTSRLRWQVIFVCVSRPPKIASGATQLIPRSLSYGFLSCAAAHLLHNDSPGNISELDASLGRLQKMLNDGVVDTGKIGELVSRFIWLLAKDFLVRSRGFDQMLGACQPISVVEFLQFVFGKRIWKDAPNAQEAFQEAYINFSHWVSMGFNINPFRTCCEELL